jgi:tetrahydromethanopterin S-methyltransferase subunit H
MDIRIIIRIHELLLVQKTGNPKDLAKRLGISERSIFNYISFMKKEMNAPIRYNSQCSSYIYNENCNFKFIGD